MAWKKSAENYKSIIENIIWMGSWKICITQDSYSRVTKINSGWFKQEKNVLKSQWVLTGLLKELKKLAQCSHSQNWHPQSCHKTGWWDHCYPSETQLWKLQVAIILPDPGTWVSPHGPCFFASLAPDSLSEKNHW